MDISAAVSVHMWERRLNMREEFVERWAPPNYIVVVAAPQIRIKQGVFDPECRVLCRAGDDSIKHTGMSL